MTSKEPDLARLGVLDQKSIVRESMLSLRKSIDAGQAADAASRVVALALSLIERYGPRVVSGYVPMRDELDCLPLLSAIAEQGIATVAPVMVAKGERLIFRLWRPGDPLVPAAFGVSEPSSSAPRLEPDLLFVPLAAFDAEGFRLGYGGGFYDRTLAALRALKPVAAIGLAYDEQRVDQVPREPTDARLDAILTPYGLLGPAATATEVSC